MLVGGEMWVGSLVGGAYSIGKLDNLFPLCVLFLVLLSSDMRMCSV